jgi:ATP-dependent RNA helicase DHX29
MYRMFPPVFRDLWLWWLKTDQQEEDAVREEQRAAKSEIIDRLLALIREINTYKHPSKQEIVASDEEDSSDSVLHRGVDCWEDNADAGVENHEPEPTNRRSSEGMKLRDEFLKRRTSSRYQSLLRQREKLPMASYKEAILEMVKTHSVTIISADTGAGKTTQCPQFLLENALLEGIGDTINIVCTQPRRVAATSIADRVAEEMADPLGDQVGYQIRMDSRKSRHTKLLFCTTGVLLRRLHDDRKLQDITHVIVDEVHERQVQTDVLLVGLKHLLSTSRRDLKIILVRLRRNTNTLMLYLPHQLRCIFSLSDVCHNGFLAFCKLFRWCTDTRSTGSNFPRSKLLSRGCLGGNSAHH